MYVGTWNKWVKKVFFEKKYLLNEMGGIMHQNSDTYCFPHKMYLSEITSILMIILNCFLHKWIILKLSIHK